LDNVIWLQWAQVLPQPGKKRWRSDKDIDLKRLQNLKDNYVKLRVKFRSIHARELDLPELRGEMIKEYRLRATGNRFVVLPF